MKLGLGKIEKVLRLFTPQIVSPFLVYIKLGGSCIKVHPRGQIAKVHLHFNTPEKI